MVRYGALTMPAQVQAVGQYEPALGCSAVVDVLDVAVRVAGQEVRAKVGRTCGVWREAKRLDYNFERLALPGTIRLPEGPVDVAIAVEGPLPEKSFNVSSLELTPLSAKKTIAAVEAEGLTCRTSADWFVQAGYGLMFHGTEGRTSMDGATKPYEQAVNDFDVTRWADMVEDTGAACAFLTANHGLPHFPAPLKFWESVNPGSTTKRDLIAEMAGPLERRG